MASAALYGSDIQSVFEIEQANEFLAQLPATPPPKPNYLSRGVNGSSPGAAELRGSSGLHLTKNELDVVQLRALSDDEICDKLEITASALRKRLQYAVERNEKLKTIKKPEELLVNAAHRDLIDMDLLPPQKQYELSAIQQKVWQEYTFASLGATAGSLDLDSEAAVSDIWTAVYQAIGAYPPINTRTHAFLIGVRDGELKA